MIAGIVGVVVGITTMVLVNQSGHGGDLLSLSEYVQFWGVVFGLVAGFVAFGVANVLVGSRRSRAGAWLLLGIITAIVGFLALLWNAAWGVPLASLEGAWLWPLAIVPFALSIVSVRRWRRSRTVDSLVDPS